METGRAVRRALPPNLRFDDRHSSISLCAALIMVIAPNLHGADPNPTERRLSAPIFVESGLLEKSVLYADGSEVDVEIEKIWRPMCGSNSSNLTVEELRRIAQMSNEAAAAHPWEGSGQGGIAAGPVGFDLVFNITSALPPGASEALTAVEKYIEAQFTDPVTVVINISFAPLGQGILGSTGSLYTNVPWPTARGGLQSGMDASDTIQDFLPAASTIPVRYDGNSATVTNENRVYFTLANYRAAIGAVAGTAASMTFSSNFSWDYTPPDISPGAYCFHSVIVHEVGHALGFTSAADFRSNDMEALDIYRFQRSDGTGTDYNPDTLAEFGTTARMVDMNAPGTLNDVNSDLVQAEYQMADGDPYQASHFAPQNPGIYIMDPSIGSSETFYPDFYRSGDTEMFDAIGWDYPPAHTSCEQAWEVGCNSHKGFDNSDVSNPPNPSYGCGIGTSHDGTLWYRFTAGATSANLSTCGSGADDSTFAVYSGDCGSLVEIACSEDGGCGEPGRSSLCITGLTVGATYFVQLSARSAATRGVYDLEISCSCPGACCLTSPNECIMMTEDECTGTDGAWAGVTTTCVGDNNGDGYDDTCDPEREMLRQPPTIGGEDFASNVDWTDFSPNQVLAEDFTSDGRPIRAVRWWGSQLSSLTQPDGWFISFHEPLAPAQAAATSLGTYYCSAEMVTITPITIAVCDPPHSAIEYKVSLADCCLLHANADSRSTLVPAQRTEFQEELCFDYEISIQAVVGTRFDEDPFGNCIETLTGNAESGDFWGWHSTAYAHGTHAAYSSAVSVAGNDRFYGPWASISPVCSTTNMAFELITSSPAGGANADCNCNGIGDEQDILNATSMDCNANGLPDECEFDCNSNNTPDDCDIALGSSLDCQTNGIPDECDLLLGISVDVNNNTIPDDCCEPADPPQAGPEADLKNRYISLLGSNPGRLTALRVTLASLQHPVPPNLPERPPIDFSAFEGEIRWIGPPTVYPEGSTPTATFAAARVQCTPHYADWAAFGLVHVFGAEIMPSSLYQVQAIDAGCDVNGESDYSVALPLSTARWGDVGAPFNPPSTTPQPDVLDISNLVSNLKNVVGAPTKVYAQLQPAILNPSDEANILDVVSAVDALKGIAYPYTGIEECPP